MEEIDGDFLVVRAGSAGCEPTWAYIVHVDGNDRYIRNAEATNDKAKAHLPFFPSFCQQSRTMYHDL
ncbi:MAG: hypothetical protein ACERJ2_01965 [Filomicrobium sp.]